MTPTEQYEELRWKIARQMAAHCYPCGNATQGEKNEAAREAMESPYFENVIQLITADRKRVALEARLEALDYVIDLQSKQFNRWTQMDIANFFDGVGKYYRELKAQQEEV